MPLHQLSSKNNGLVLLLKAIVTYSNCILSSVATDDKDGNGLKLEKIRPFFFFQVLIPCLRNSPKSYYG